MPFDDFSEFTEYGEQTQEEIQNELDIPSLKDLRFDDFDLGGQPAESTYANGLFDMGNINPNMMLESGQYIFTIKTEKGSVSEINKIIEDTVTAHDDNGNVKDRKFSIDKTVYDEDTKRLKVWVTLEDDPAVVLIYGAVCAVLFVIGALSINSVLESVTKVSSSVGSLISKPASILLILIFLVPVLAPYLPKGKSK